MRTHAIVLAAGASTRMGRMKLLLPVRGRTLLASAVTPLLEAGLERVVVVLGFQAEAVRGGAGLAEDGKCLVFVVNEDWPRGLSSSLRAGIRACVGADAVIVALGDQPSLRADVVGRLVAAAEAQSAPLAVPMHEGRVSHPILFRRELLPELEELEGDSGAREVVRRHIDQAVVIVGDAPRDLDTEADYLAFLEGRPGREDEGLPVRPR